MEGEKTVIFLLLAIAAAGHCALDVDEDLVDPLLDAAEEYFVHLDESDNSACRLAGTSFVRTVRSGQGWEVAVREATRAVDAALKHDTLTTLDRLRKPCLDFVVAFEKAVAEPMADTDPCSAGTLLMIDSLENKGLDVTAAFRDAMSKMVGDSTKESAVPSQSC